MEREEKSVSGLVDKILKKAKQLSASAVLNSLLPATLSMLELCVGHVYGEDILRI